MFANTILNVRIVRGADCSNTNHMLVISKIKINIKKTRETRKMKTRGLYDVQKLHGTWKWERINLKE